MSTQLESTLMQKREAAAKEANLVILSAESSRDLNNTLTAKFRLGLAENAPQEQTLTLELSDHFDFNNKSDLLSEMVSHLREEARRLKNPRPDVYVTLGLPVRFSGFRWPFHRSTSGADTYIVHGTVHLEDGHNSPLHALVSASMTVTFAEIVSAPEQPYAETFIYNAIRKTLDQGQLELLKSGNRQPVNVTTRFYSRWKKAFMFTDTDEASRKEFVATKVYWLSHELGADAPVWIADPRDAQYLNTTPIDLVRAAKLLAAEGLVPVAEGSEFATATPLLVARGESYHAKLAGGLSFTN